MLNRAIVQGRLGADPELKYTANDIPVCSFRIAVSRPQSRDGEQGTDWISIVAWRQTAEFISRYFTKGSMILVEGRLQVREYIAHDGSKRNSTEIVADRAHFCGKNDPSSGTGNAAATAQSENRGYNTTSSISQYAPNNMYNQSAANVGFTELSEYAYDDDLPF